LWSGRTEKREEGKENRPRICLSWFFTSGETVTNCYRFLELFLAADFFAGFDLDLFADFLVAIMLPFVLSSVTPRHVSFSAGTFDNAYSRKICKWLVPIFLEKFFDPKRCAMFFERKN
jgi:hypothetical protein